MNNPFLFTGAAAANTMAAFTDQGPHFQRDHGLSLVRRAVATSLAGAYSASTSHFRENGPAKCEISGRGVPNGHGVVAFR